MEKIRILEDGTIPEVKMSSQGLGDPFGPGERIEGYRVCGLRGSAFVGGPEGEAERIVGICPGDEMMFRYLQGEPVYTELEFESGGSGQLEVWLDDCLAAADLVICRAGASTLSELEAAGRASILIPSPKVAENHQYHNGMVLVKNEAALLIEEKDLTGEKLCGAVEELARDPQRLRRLGQNAQKLAMIDANERIYEELMRLLRSAK